MGRKRNQGKARKAAKAKAREEAEEERNHSTDGQQLSPALLQQLQSGNAMRGAACVHGLEKMDHLCAGFVDAFNKFFTSGEEISLVYRLKLAEDATMDKFADVWNDSTKMEIAMSYFLFVGTQEILDGRCADSLDSATIIRYMEQYIAVVLHQTQALICTPKIEEISDEHSLVKLFRRRIPCSCLDNKYEEVKSITKMGFCYSPQCPDRRVERNKTMYCSRCRSVTYCSRECQKADWARHKSYCDNAAIVKAAF